MKNDVDIVHHFSLDILLHLAVFGAQLVVLLLDVNLRSAARSNTSLLVPILQLMRCYLFSLVFTPSCSFIFEWRNHCFYLVYSHFLGDVTGSVNKHWDDVHSLFCWAVGSWRHQRRPISPQLWRRCGPRCLDCRTSHLRSHCSQWPPPATFLCNSKWEAVYDPEEAFIYGHLSVNVQSLHNTGGQHRARKINKYGLAVSLRRGQQERKLQSPASAQCGPQQSRISAPAVSSFQLRLPSW